MVVAGGVLTALGLGVGIGTVAAGLVMRSDAEALRGRLDASGNHGMCAGNTGGECQRLRDLTQQQRLLLNTGVWSSAGGLLAGVATLVYVQVTGNQKTPVKGMTVVPALGQSAGGLAVTGTW